MRFFYILPRSKSVISVLTDGHCLCCYHDTNIHCRDATAQCKPHNQIHDPNDAKKMIDVPVNQHTGQHWTLDSDQARETDNSITVQVQRKVATELMDYLAMDAYIMSTKMKDGKVVSGQHYGVYDIGVIRCIVSNKEYSELGLKNLELPNV